MIKVPATKIHQFQKELKMQQVKHYPFRKNGNFYEVEFFPESKITFLLLKYDHRLD